MNKNQGFTLIELLVVIAIVGVLASVVIASLLDARKKNADTAAKQALSSGPPQSELYYQANSYSYAGVCTSGATAGAGVKSIYEIVLSSAKAQNLAVITVNGTGTLSTATCNTSASAWAAEVPLQYKNIGGAGASAMFCTDSVGFVGYKAATIGAGVSC